MVNFYYYALNVENIFSVNFYISAQNFCFFFKGLDFLPECCLLFFLLYGLVSIFNDQSSSFLQYYRWLFFFIIVLICLCFISTSSNETTLAFGFTFINCWFTKVSKICILILTISVLYASKTRLVLNKKLESLEFPLVMGFSVFFFISFNIFIWFFRGVFGVRGVKFNVIRFSCNFKSQYCINRSSN